MHLFRAVLLALEPAWPQTGAGVQFIGAWPPAGRCLPQGAPGKSELRCPGSHEPRCDPPQPQGSRQREQSRGHEFLLHLRPQHKEGCGLLRIAGVPREASWPCPELQLTLRCPPGRIPMTPAELSLGGEVGSAPRRLRRDGPGSSPHRGSGMSRGGPRCPPPGEPSRRASKFFVFFPPFSSVAALSFL